jgi:hypothetical protein
MNDTVSQKHILKDGRKRRALQVSDHAWDVVSRLALRNEYRTVSLLVEAIGNGEIELRKKEEEERK